MKAKALTIHWHQDSQPIYSAHFQPLPPGVSPVGVLSRRLATAGGDNNVRLWRVNLADPSHPTYLATLAKHTQAVNVVRFDPKGTLLASAGDDGTIILWTPEVSASASGFGTTTASSIKPAFGASEDTAGAEDKESWRILRICRTSIAEIYDLAWSPDSAYILAGSMDNVARVYSAATGQCVRELAEHSHYVQGVAWDPHNEYIATQSSDRSVHIYSLKTKDGVYILGGGAAAATTATVATAAATATAATAASTATASANSSNSSLSVSGSSISAPHHKIARADLPVRILTAPNTNNNNSIPLQDSALHPPASKFRASASPSPHLSASSAPHSLAPPTPTSLSELTGPSSVASPESYHSDTSIGPGSVVSSLTSSKTSAMNPPAPKSSHSRKSSFGSSSSATSTPSATTATVSSTLTNFGFSSNLGSDSNNNSNANSSNSSNNSNSSSNSSSSSSSNNNNTGTPIPTSSNSAPLLPPPPPPPPSSSTSNHPQSPISTASSSRPSSPSPSFLPLPAVRSIGSPSVAMSMMLSRSSYLYHSETLVSFFRRLTFSPDGSLLLTPSGMFKYAAHDAFDRLGTPTVPAPAPLTNNPLGSGSSSGEDVTNTVYIYTRAGLNRPPVAHLPGLKKPSLAVGCSPVFYKLRNTPRAVAKPVVTMTFDNKSLEDTDSTVPSAAPSPVPSYISPHPLNSPNSKIRNPRSTPEPPSATPPPIQQSQQLSAPVFSLKYRMVYAVITQDTVIVYDTEQRQPLCVVSNLNYSAFTDLTWSPDGNILLVTSTDGFCSVIIFENGELGERYTDPIPAPPAFSSSNYHQFKLSGQPSSSSNTSHSTYPHGHTLSHHHPPNPSLFQLPIHSPRKRTSDPRPPLPSTALVAAAAAQVAAAAGSPQSTTTTTNSSRASSRASSPAAFGGSLGGTSGNTPSSGFFFGGPLVPPSSSLGPPSHIQSATSATGSSNAGPVPVVSPMPSIVGHGTGVGYNTPPHTPVPLGQAQLATTSVPSPVSSSSTLPTQHSTSPNKAEAGTTSSNSNPSVILKRPGQGSSTDDSKKKKKRRIAPTLIGKIE
ncbi:uncharacterized protein SAPINGB_P004516 [Magnusiomyces paraingens]|uniref:CAF1B/HIR1 beta-propeller domain-containing protein n=1 Tax=Magnusiomyces paraingens TaxID=2606893 RepID=A0A5E8BU74_9ASCO|nr:uncharacterized protein SAPINGB_P004516 [Saprochaete ingens]VVT55278.1 unnamed protein product [Saprochaete ingens]